jgi:hypothetical protein
VFAGHRCRAAGRDSQLKRSGVTTGASAVAEGLEDASAGEFCATALAGFSASAPAVAIAHVIVQKLEVLI